MTHHPKMSDAEWEETYRLAWEAFYTEDHVRTILKRAAACKLGRPGTTLTTLLWFKLASAFEDVHPLEAGAFRLKYRRDRRSGLPRENPVRFYGRYAKDILVKLGQYGGVYFRWRRILKEVLAAPDRWTYIDTAIAAPKADEYETLDLYKQTAGADAALARKRRSDAIREGTFVAKAG